MANKPFIGLILRTKRGLPGALKEAATALEVKISENAGLTDHTLQDLAELGHPYSKANPTNIHRPKFKVHAQDGDLQNAIGQQQAGKDKIFVGVDTSKAPHAEHVILGTSKMVARDFITGSFKEIEKELRDIVEKSISKMVKGSK